jgi:hypothetical protein
MKDLHIYQKKYNQYKALYLLNQQGGYSKYYLAKATKYKKKIYFYQRGGVLKSIPTASTITAKFVIPNNLYGTPLEARYINGQAINDFIVHMSQSSAAGSVAAIGGNSGIPNILLTSFLEPDRQSPLTVSFDKIFFQQKLVNISLSKLPGHTDHQNRNRLIEWISNDKIKDRTRHFVFSIDFAHGQPTIIPQLFLVAVHNLLETERARLEKTQKTSTANPATSTAIQKLEQSAKIVMDYFKDLEAELTDLFNCRSLLNQWIIYYDEECNHEEVKWYQIRGKHKGKGKSSGKRGGMKRKSSEDAWDPSREESKGDDSDGEGPLRVVDGYDYPGTVTSTKKRKSVENTGQEPIRFGAHPKMDTSGSYTFSSSILPWPTTNPVEFNSFERWIDNFYKEKNNPRSREFIVKTAKKYEGNQQALKKTLEEKYGKKNIFFTQQEYSAQGQEELHRKGVVEDEDPEDAMDTHDGLELHMTDLAFSAQSLEEEPEHIQLIYAMTYILLKDMICVLSVLYHQFYAEHVPQEYDTCDPASATTQFISSNFIEDVLKTHSTNLDILNQQKLVQKEKVYGTSSRIYNAPTRNQFILKLQEIVKKGVNSRIIVKKGVNSSSNTTRLACAEKLRNYIEPNEVNEERRHNVYQIIHALLEFSSIICTLNETTLHSHLDLTEFFNTTAAHKNINNNDICIINKMLSEFFWYFKGCYDIILPGIEQLNSVTRQCVEHAKYGDEKVVIDSLNFSLAEMWDAAGSPSILNIDDTTLWQNVPIYLNKTFVCLTREHITLRILMETLVKDMIHDFCPSKSTKSTSDEVVVADTDSNAEKGPRAQNLFEKDGFFFQYTPQKYLNFFLHDIQTEMFKFFIPHTLTLEEFQQLQEVRTGVWTNPNRRDDIPASMVGNHTIITQTFLIMEPPRVPQSKVELINGVHAQIGDHVTALQYSLIYIGSPFLQVASLVNNVRDELTFAHQMQQKYQASNKYRLDILRYLYYYEDTRMSTMVVLVPGESVSCYHPTKKNWYPATLLEREANGSWQVRDKTGQTTNVLKTHIRTTSMQYVWWHGTAVDVLDTIGYTNLGKGVEIEYHHTKDDQWYTGKIMDINGATFHVRIVDNDWKDTANTDFPTNDKNLISPLLPDCLNKLSEHGDLLNSAVGFKQVLKTLIHNYDKPTGDRIQDVVFQKVINNIIIYCKKHLQDHERLYNYPFNFNNIVLYIHGPNGSMVSREVYNNIIWRCPKYSNTFKNSVRNISHCINYAKANGAPHSTIAFLIFMKTLGDFCTCCVAISERILHFTEDSSCLAYAFLCLKNSEKYIISRRKYVGPEVHIKDMSYGFGSNIEEGSHGDPLKEVNIWNDVWDKSLAHLNKSKKKVAWQPTLPLAATEKTTFVNRMLVLSQAYTTACHSWK